MGKTGSTSGWRDDEERMVRGAPKEHKVVNGATQCGVEQGGNGEEKTGVNSVDRNRDVPELLLLRGYGVPCVGARRAAAGY